MILDSKIPEGPLEDKWRILKDRVSLVSPANKRKISIIVVGTGLAGASAAATLAEQGYNVTAFCYQDSPRRAHSVAAQGGINATKNYQGDGDSVYRLFCDTMRGGDYRSREANVYRLSEVSNNIIDQCVAQGVPFARDYSGKLENRSFGGSLVSRTFYARGQTGQQLLLGAYSAYNRQVNRGKINSRVREEMLDLVLIKGKARGIITRDLVTGKINRYSAHAVVIASGGYGNVFFLSTNAMGCNVTAIWRAYKRGAAFANPCFTQIHPTCIPASGDYQSKLALMSESLRNDGRIWVPKSKEHVIKLRNNEIEPKSLLESERDYFLERIYPAFGNLVPRDVAARAIKNICDQGYGVNKTGQAVFLDFSSAIDYYGREKLTMDGEDNITQEKIDIAGKKIIEDRYGNIFHIYEKIKYEDPYTTPMQIYPAVHYTMGGLWVDYHLGTTIPGCYAIGEANFSDHGANRLGASALMQGLADGYFILPNTIGDYLSKEIYEGQISDSSEEFLAAEKKVEERIDGLLSIKGEKTTDSFHKELGKIMWKYVGISRNESGLDKALSGIRALRESFYKDLLVTGSKEGINTELEKALRVADFFEIAELMAIDAKDRKESCGGHFREEYQDDKGELVRNDKDFANVSVWINNDYESTPKLIREELSFETLGLNIRSYK